MADEPEGLSDRERDLRRLQNIERQVCSPQFIHASLICRRKCQSLLHQGKLRVCCLMADSTSQLQPQQVYESTKMAGLYHAISTGTEIGTVDLWQRLY